MSENKQKLRCAVVGLGIGQMHIGSYQECPYSDLVAICDINAVRLKEVGNKFGIPEEKRYLDIGEMLAKENLDVCSIAVPNHLHKELTIQGLDLANVGLPGAIGFTVGVRHILTVNNTLSADTAFCHDLTPPYYGFGPVRL